jgi:hypothetical protein
MARRGMARHGSARRSSARQGFYSLTEITMSSLPRFEPSLDVKILCDILLAAKIGDVVTYDTISDAIGRDITQFRYIAASAIRSVQNSHQFVFSCIPKVGYKRLNNSEIVGKGEQFIKHIKRTSKRGAKNLACVQYAQLSDNDKISHNTRMTIFAMVQDNTSTKTNRIIEQIVSDSNTALPSAKAAIELLAHIK